MSLTAVKDKYWEATKIQILQLIWYRSDFFGKWLAHIFTIVIYFFVWKMVFDYFPAFAGLTFESVFTYLFLALAFRRLGSFWEESWAVEQAIQKGNILIFLVRPINYFWYRISLRFSYILILGLFFLPFIMYIPYHFLGILPPGFPELFYVLILFAMGFLALLLLYHCIGILTFWLGEISGIQHGVHIVSWLFGGAVIPIALLPSYARTLSEILPFYHQAGVPALIYLHRAGWNEFVSSALILLAWIVLLELLRRILWKKGLEHYDGKG